MSKATDALEELELLEGFVSRHAGEIVTEESFAIIRDYITTTEAGRAGVIKGQELSAGQIMDAMKCGTMACAECSMRPAWAKWSCIEYLARDLTASAARIKELEEALQSASIIMQDRKKALYVLMPAMIQDTRDKMETEDAKVEAALSGARKVEPC